MIQCDITFEVRFHDEKPLSASADFIIEAPGCILAQLFYADEAGLPLPGYAIIKALPLTEGRGFWRLDNDAMLPEDAACILCRVFDDSMKEIVFPEMCFFIPAHKRGKKETPLLRLALSSDFHVGGDYFHNRENRFKALQSLAAMQADALLISGDITDNAYPEHYIEARKLLEQHFPQTPVFVCSGNHDHSPYAVGAVPHLEDMRSFFLWQMEHDRALNVQTSDLYNFYFAGETDALQVLAVNSNRENNRYIIDDEQLAWLDEALTRTDGTGKMRVVMSHFHVKGTVGVTPWEYGAKFISNNDALQAVLNKHGRLVYLSGHTHAKFDSDNRNVFFDDEHNILYVNGGCMVWGDRNRHARSEYYDQHTATGHLLEIYDNKVIDRGYDLLNEQVIPRCLHKVDTKL